MSGQVVVRSGALKELAGPVNGLPVPLDLPNQDGANVRHLLLQTTMLLQEIGKDKSVLGTLSTEELAAFVDAAGRISRRHPRMGRKNPWRAMKARDDKILSKTAIRTLRDQPVFPTPDAPTAGHAQGDEWVGKTPVMPTIVVFGCCYVCKKQYTQPHDFHNLCRACAAINYRVGASAGHLRARSAAHSECDSVLPVHI